MNNDYELGRQCIDTFYPIPAVFFDDAEVERVGATMRPVIVETAERFAAFWDGVPRRVRWRIRYATWRAQRRKAE